MKENSETSMSRKKSLLDKEKLVIILEQKRDAILVSLRGTHRLRENGKYVFPFIYMGRVGGKKEKWLPAKTAFLPARLHYALFYINTLES